MKLHSPTSLPSSRAAYKTFSALMVCILLMSHFKTQGAATLADALDAPNLTWVGQAGTTPWNPDSAETHDGVDAALASLDSQAGIAAIGTTVTGPGLVTFWWKAAREIGGSFQNYPITVGTGNSPSAITSLAQYNLDTNLVGGWQKSIIGIGSGSQRVWWVLNNLVGTNRYASTGWVDQVTFVKADTNVVVDRAATPSRTSRADWAGKYYKRLIEIPDDGNHPAKDITGIDANREQSGLVWLGAGDWLGTASTKRTVTVGADKILLFEAWGNECHNFGSDSPEIIDEQLVFCIQQYGPPANTFMEIDGWRVPNISQYRVVSKPYRILLPFPNVLGISGGIAGRAMADQIQVMFKGLTPGEHLVRFGTDTDTITYEVNVLPAPETAPIIHLQPNEQTTRQGDRATFSVFATGKTPLSYQWFYNQTNALNGATNSVLQLSSIQKANEGLYSVTISNELDTITSHAVQLNLAVQPVIVSSPQPRTNVIGSTAFFSVTVTNTASLPLTFRWKMGTREVWTNTVYDTTSTFYVSNVTLASAANYSVTVSNVFRATTVSTSARLTVIPSASATPPTVSLQVLNAPEPHFAPAVIQLSALANDSDGFIDHVEFYSEDQYLGSSFTPPYRFDWKYASAGTFNLSAKAIDNVGASSVSQPVPVNVVSVGIATPGQRIEGIAYDNWPARWWNWLYAIPTNQAPSLDPSGAHGHLGQSGPVWFLAGTSDTTPAVRKVVIPRGKYIFLPLINVINDYPCPDAGFEPPPGVSLEAFLSSTAKAIIDTTTNLTASLDGRSITDFAPFRLRSPLFDFQADPSWIPYDSCAFNQPNSQGVTDGYWLMLEPLASGQHTLVFTANNFYPGVDPSGNPTLSPFGTQNVTYEITILPDTFTAPYELVAGKSQSEWSASWWQWALSLPVETNPLLDQTGANVQQRQFHEVFFLGSYYGLENRAYNVSRSLTVPYGKPLFFPVLAGTTDNTDVSPPLDIQNLRSLLAPTYDEVTELFVAVDNVKIAGLQSFRQQSPPFGMVLPDNNILESVTPGYQGGGIIDPIVSDGFWVMLQPLPPGQHTISYGGKLASGFELAITNRIEVTLPRVAPASESYLGQTYAEWSTNWWRWVMNYSTAQNPLMDVSGQFGHLGQTGQVWFLSSVQDRVLAHRQLVIPSGKSLFFPTLMINADYPCVDDPNFIPEPGESLEQFLTRIANNIIDDSKSYVDTLQLTLDGIRIPNDKIQRATSKMFKFRAKPDLKQSFDPCVTGQDQFGVSDGYWVMLEPLSVGRHTLSFNARAVNGSGSFIDCTYDLLVLPPGAVLPTSTIANKTRQQWSTEWWKWIAQQSASSNPGLDTSGSNANNGQSSSPVFFLADQWGLPTAADAEETIIRHFHAPASHYLMVPCNVVEQDNTVFNPDLSTAKLHDEALKLLHAAPRGPRGKIDGIDFLPSFQPVTNAPTFSFQLPIDNIFKQLDSRYTDGLSVTGAVSDGHWLMVEPLAPGEHYIEYGGGFASGFKGTVRAYVSVFPADSSRITNTKLVSGQLHVTYWTAQGKTTSLETAPTLLGPWTQSSVPMTGNQKQITTAVPVEGNVMFVRVKVQ